MYSIEEANEIMENKAKEFFEKYFIGKDINTILYESSRKVVIELTSNLAQFRIITMCLSGLNDDKELCQHLDSDIRKNLSDTINAIDEICNTLEEILDPIVEELISTG